MIPTLLKHEWLRTRGLLGTVLGLAAGATVLGALLSATGWPLLSTLGMLVGLIAVMAIIPVLQLALTADYWRSSYGRTGYFTHSLPVPGSKIYLAKLVWVVLVTLAALVVTALLFAIFWLGAAARVGMERNPLLLVQELWTSVSAVTPPWLIAIGAIAFLALCLIWPVYYFFAVSIGNESRLHRFGLGGPVVVFVGLYLVMQVALVLGMIVLPFGIGMQDGQLGLVSFSLIEEMHVGVGPGGDVMPLGFLPPLVLFAVLCLWRTVQSWNHRTALA